MKKWKTITLMVLGLMMTMVIFCRTVTSAYAYTEEEIQMAKDWLSSHGYAPTMAGAEQAYQDYLNGMWGGPGGEEVEEPEPPMEEQPIPEIIELEQPEVEVTVSENMQPIKESTEVAIIEEVDSTVEEEDVIIEETVTETETMEEETETISQNKTSETEESTLEIEVQSDVETEEVIVKNNYDGIIVIVCAFVCVAMICGTIYYIKRS